MWSGALRSTVRTCRCYGKAWPPGNYGWGAPQSCNATRTGGRRRHNKRRAFLPSRHRRHGTAPALRKSGHLEAFIHAIQVSTGRAGLGKVRVLGTRYSAGRCAATIWTRTTAGWPGSWRGSVGDVPPQPCRWDRIG